MVCIFARQALNHILRCVKNADFHSVSASAPNDCHADPGTSNNSGRHYKCLRGLPPSLDAASTCSSAAASCSRRGAAAESSREKAQNKLLARPSPSDPATIPHQLLSGGRRCCRLTCAVMETAQHPLIIADDHSSEAVGYRKSSRSGALAETTHKQTRRGGRHRKQLRGAHPAVRRAPLFSPVYILTFMGSPTERPHQSNSPVLRFHFKRRRL